MTKKNEAFINNNTNVTAETVTSMIGLADRGKIYDLLESVAEGNASKSLIIFRDLYNSGADILMIFEELLNAVHSITQIKISPDLNEEQIADIVVLIKDLKLDGIIATNTTVSRDGATSKHKTQEGGMSGKLLTQKSNSIIKYLRKSLGDNFPIIGVGGIMSANDAIERLNSGADLIQLYTGFIYRGPSFIKEINKAIINQSN